MLLCENFAKKNGLSTTLLHRFAQDVPFILGLPNDILGRDVAGNLGIILTIFSDLLANECPDR